MLMSYAYSNASVGSSALFVKLDSLLLQQQKQKITFKDREEVELWSKALYGLCTSPNAFKHKALIKRVGDLIWKFH